MFLLGDGSFTLMNIASVMFLAILLSSLPTILKLSRNTLWPVVFWWSMMGDGALVCSLNLSPKVLPDSPMYSSSQSTLPHLYLYITPLFLSMVSLSLGCTSRSLMVLPSGDHSVLTSLFGSLAEMVLPHLVNTQTKLTH